MEIQHDYLAKNKASWNKRTAVHVDSDFYNNQAFMDGKSSLNAIELALLGNVSGLKILHLQCHFGQDSISLSRLGASVTGVDLSDQAIETARALAKKTKQSTKFICCDIYDLPNHLNEEFDIVFTSYGTIGWLPDMTKWANIVQQFLKPCGKFVFVEFHPVVWMFDDDFSKVAYNYFNDGPIVETESGTYADRDASIESEYVMWNHSMGEVISALLSSGLELQDVQEYDYSPYPCFRHVDEFEPGKFRIEGFENRLPMVYSLKAKKKPINKF